jgi:hypothetical protein
MDTFFLIRVTGIQEPRKALTYQRYALLICCLLAVMTIVYVFFSFSYTWKVDVMNEVKDGEPKGNLQEETDPQSSRIPTK